MKQPFLRRVVAFAFGLTSLMGLFLALVPVASAHEVYVLSSAQIAQAVSTPPFDMVTVAKANLHEFMFWGFITALVIVGVFFISIIRFLEERLDPLLVTLRPYAPLVARVTVGLSFLAAAYYQASYGPELPLINTYGHLTPIITTVLVIIGLLTILGLYARLAASIALVMYGIAVWFHGWYMLTYINYMGEIIVLLVLGAHAISLDAWFAKQRKKTKPRKNWLTKAQQWLAPRSFAILRICFGISLLYASAYAKIIHNNLALDTVLKYHLDHILGFEAHFLVLGAAIIELIIGIFIVVGIEIRFAALYFEFWLTLSLCFFGEAVWPHIILIGIPIALVMYGYDDYSLEGYCFCKKEYEPIL